MALSPLDFPASPTIGQTYPSPPVAGQPTYIWDGADWLSYFALGKAYVPLDGSTAMTGLLTLSGDPTVVLQAVTKQYADAIAAATTAAIAALGAHVIAECGRLNWISATALSFVPFKGDQLKIAGAYYAIPAGGIVGLGVPTSVFLNGVPAQTLAINTTYYVYAFVNAGVLTADFSTVGHATSATAGNNGTEIKTGDDTRTLIGMVRTDATVAYLSDLTTVSWFNRRWKAGSYVGNMGVGANPSLVTFVSWANAVATGFSGSYNCNTPSNNSAFATVDGTAVGAVSYDTVTLNSYYSSHSGNVYTSVSEGLHIYGVTCGASGATFAVFSASVMVFG